VFTYFLVAYLSIGVLYAVYTGYMFDVRKYSVVPLLAVACGILLAMVIWPVGVGFYLLGAWYKWRNRCEQRAHEVWMAKETVTLAALHKELDMKGAEAVQLKRL
jgi:hypothetical protein